MTFSAIIEKLLIWFDIDGFLLVGEEFHAPAVAWFGCVVAGVVLRIGEGLRRRLLLQVERCVLDGKIGIGINPLAALQGFGKPVVDALLHLIVITVPQPFANAPSPLVLALRLEQCPDTDDGVHNTFD